MLDAGLCLPAIGFAFRRGGRGYWIIKGIFSSLSSIEHLASSPASAGFRRKQCRILFLSTCRLEALASL
jgi:hypothetical protein